MAYELAAFFNSTLNAFYANAVGSGSDDAEVEAITRFRDKLVSLAPEFTKLGLPDPLSILEQIDARIAGFEMTIVPETEGPVDPNKPYDKESLKREFLEEVYSAYLYVTRAIKNTAADGEPAVWAINTTYANTGILADLPLTDFTGHSLDVAKEDGSSLDDAQKILAYYTSLIDATFVAGQSLKTVNDPATGSAANVWVVTAITPITIGNKLYDRITSVYTGLDATTKEPTYKNYLVEYGINLSTVVKTPVPATGTPVTFELSFTQGTVFGSADGTDTATLIQVVMDDDGNITPSSDPPDIKTIANFRALSPMEFLYYWNEARIQILKAQLAFKQAIVKEAQEDLRQANEALALLEKVANIRSQDEKGNIVTDSSNESIAMNLFNARASTAGNSIFDRSDSTPYSHVWAKWQSNRANLKNYIDRKSAQSQDLMLDYQQVLNRYNTALEVMSKLQEKLDSMLKSQLRNL